MTQRDGRQSRGKYNIGFVISYETMPQLQDKIPGLNKDFLKASYGTKEHSASRKGTLEERHSTLL